MDAAAFALSLQLAVATCAVLLAIAVPLGRWLAWRAGRAKGLVEALVALPLILPPTVLGYYLLVAFGQASPLGRLFADTLGVPLVFTFEGLLAASVLVNLPFAVQPIQRAFEAIPNEVREAGWCAGLSPWRTFRRIELPLARPGLVTAVALTFAHTLGEFGVVLMVGGNIPGETRTLSIAIYDRVQAFDAGAAGTMAAALLAVSFVAIAVVYSQNRKTP
jgi:molybdate transport system permease protein